MRIGVLLLSAAIAVSASAQTYFKEGAKFVSLITSTTTDTPTESVETLTIEKCDRDGSEALGAFITTESSEKSQSPVGYFKTEGKRVFYSPVGASDWYLIYDFGLKLGHGCDIYQAIRDADNIANSAEYMVYVDFNRDNNFSSWLQMDMYQYDEIGDTPSHPHKGVWLDGLCSSAGPLYNTFGLDGIGSRLMEIWDGETLIYQDDTVKPGHLAVNDINDNSGLNVAIDGHTATFSSQTPVDATVFSENGMVIDNFRLLGDKTLTLESGIYILRAGKFTRKFMVR